MYIYIIYIYICTCRNSHYVCMQSPHVHEFLFVTRLRGGIQWKQTFWQTFVMAHTTRTTASFLYTGMHSLGSHTKVHKLGKYLCSCRFSYVHVFTVQCFTGLFYFLLGNGHPKYRSKLKAVQLVAICKHHYIKQYSLDAILHPFLQDLKKLVCCFLFIYTHVYNLN